MADPYIGEFLGTMMLVLLGDGVIANVLLRRTKGEGSGWIVITTGWGLALMVAVAVSIVLDGYGHVNPAITLAAAYVGLIDWGVVPGVFIAQFLGGFFGAVLMFLAYYSHFLETDDPDLKLAVFTTMPQIRNLPLNTITEAIGTAVLAAGVMAIITLVGDTLWAAPLLVGLLLWAIGLGLGGPTRFSLNQARDLAPRIAYAIRPVPGKRDPDWVYGFTAPFIGPFIGGFIGGLLFLLIV